jgi:hypothetical protein
MPTLPESSEGSIYPLFYCPKFVMFIIIYPSHGVLILVKEDAKDKIEIS